MKSFASLVVFAALVSGLPDARAQDARSLASDMIGQWELSTAGRDKTCVITLRSDATPQGMKLELEKGCGDVLPFTKAIATWSVKGLDIVRLQDAKGQSVIDVTEVESGIFEGTRSGEGVYLLQNLAAARALSKSTDQLIGDWTMVRGNGNAVCSLTLTNTPAENSKDNSKDSSKEGSRENSQDNFQVFLKPRCEPAVAAFAPVMWRMDRGEIQLVSAKGEIWRFEADDNAQWRLVPDTADPLIMTRQ